MKKVLLVSEYLNPPYDEGIKKTVYNLFLNLDKQYDLKVICRFGFEKDNIFIVDENSLFFSNKIKRFIKDFGPDSLIYFPFQSSTFASYLRLKILSNYCGRSAKSTFIALQPKPLKKWERLLVNFIKPKVGLTPSPTLHRFWNDMNIENDLIPLLTNLEVFKPNSSKSDKLKLREKYEIPSDAFVISHMGHLNEGRNLRTLIPLQKSDNQIVVVASSSTPIDAIGQNNLKNALIESGIIIINRFIDNIQEIYHLSDIYIFPVQGENSSIGMPLSVLEARACGTPVVSTNYGSLDYFLGDDNHGIRYSKPEDFVATVDMFKKKMNFDSNKTKVSELNELFYRIVQEKL